MRFASRQEAGRELGLRLAQQGAAPDLVLGLPRGGVLVAAEVARILHRPLEILVVRKLGHPRQPEYAVGALAEPDLVLLDDAAQSLLRENDTDLQRIIASETLRLKECASKFHGENFPLLREKSVLIVDDGLATGATAEAAVRSARNRGAREITVAVPVSSASAARRIEAVAEKFISLSVDQDFAAVGQYYRSFPQTTDEEVLAALSNAE